MLTYGISQKLLARQLNALLCLSVKHDKELITKTSQLNERDFIIRVVCFIKTVTKLFLRTITFC